MLGRLGRRVFSSFRGVSMGLPALSVAAFAGYKISECSNLPRCHGASGKTRPNGSSTKQLCKADAVCGTAGGIEDVCVARVVHAPPHIVWKEIRDFIEQTHYFGFRQFTTNPSPNIGGDVTGCVRHIAPDGSDPVEEILVDHDDKAMRFSLTLTPSLKVPFLGYRGTTSVSPLGVDGKQCLLTYHGTFEGLLESGHEFTEQSSRAILAGAYQRFFAAIAKDVEVPHGRLAGKVCVVTGGASGLGEAMCKAFANEGATVVIADMNEASGVELECQIKDSSFMKVDVSNPSDVNALMQDVAMKHGRLDVVVNNAGIGGLHTSTAEYPTADWDRVRSINLDGAFFVLRAALKQMQNQNPSGGVVLNMSSILGLSGFASMPGYTAAKAALVGLTSSTAVEYAGVGVRVVCIAPTGVQTPLVAGVEQQMDPSCRYMNPIPGKPLPEDVANAAVFLCSDEAKWVTGCVLPVDGGYLAGNAGGCIERGVSKV